jgi:Fic family protein
MDKWMKTLQINQMELEVQMDGSVNIADVTITPELLRLISALDEFKGAWRAIGRIAPERLAALKHGATIESVASSTRIEGAKLTDHEVERLLSSLEVKSFTTRDEQEVAGYADAMETVFGHWDAIDLHRGRK